MKPGHSKLKHLHSQHIQITDNVLDSGAASGVNGKSIQCLGWSTR